MGFKLRREVRDLLPPGLLTARERCLVLEIADSCNDEERRGFPGVEWLADKADMPESKVGETLTSIGKKWIDLRVPLGVGKDGRPYYSKPRYRTTYLFPPREQLDAILASKAPRNGVPKAPESGAPKAPRNRGRRSPETGGPSPYRSPDGSPQERSEVECSPSGRFAPSGAGDDEDDPQPLILEVTEPRTSGWNDWRAEDYQRFIDALGTDKVYSSGGKAGPAGHYTAHALYGGMQRMPDGKKEWPGRYLEAMQERGGDEAVDEWLARYDLERA